MIYDSLDIRGTIEEPDEENPGQTALFVYQRVAPGQGNISNGGKFDRQRRRYVVPTDPATAPQLDRRARMAAAVAAWHAASPENRSAYAEAARVRRITVFNAFISNFLRS